MNRLKKIYQANGPPKQTVLILILDKVDFKHKLVRRNKEDHFILIKGVIHQEEIAIVNLYVSNVRTPNFTNHTLLDLKTQIDPNTVGDFNTLLSPIRQVIQTKNQQRNPRIK
jgi:hypothetical protein